MRKNDRRIFKKLTYQWTRLLLSLLVGNQRSAKDRSSWLVLEWTVEASPRRRRWTHSRQTRTVGPETGRSRFGRWPRRLQPSFFEAIRTFILDSHWEKRISIYTNFTFVCSSHPPVFILHAALPSRAYYYRSTGLFLFTLQCPEKNLLLKETIQLFRFLLRPSQKRLDCQ